MGMLTLGSLAGSAQTPKPGIKEVVPLTPTLESLDRRVRDLEAQLSELQKRAVKKPAGVSPIRPLRRDGKADDPARRVDIAGLQEQIDQLIAKVNEIAEQVNHLSR